MIEDRPLKAAELELLLILRPKLASSAVCLVRVPVRRVSFVERVRAVFR